MLPLLLLTACGDLSCDRLYMPDLLLVRLSSSDWPAGTYTVTLTDTDTFDTLTCTATLPGSDVPCDDELSLLKVVDGALLQLEAWDFAPDTVTVEVSEVGTALFLDDFSPTYEEDEPNGEGCGVQRVGAVDAAW